jgi:hypothetical protein
MATVCPKPCLRGILTSPRLACYCAGWGSVPYNCVVLYKADSRSTQHLNNLQCAQVADQWLHTQTRAEHTVAFPRVATLHIKAVPHPRLAQQYPNPPHNGLQMHMRAMLSNCVDVPPRIAQPNTSWLWRTALCQQVALTRGSASVHGRCACLAAAWVGVQRRGDAGSL